MASDYPVTCYNCQRPFDATQAAWCGCDLKSKTLVCPHCSTCFCKAPDSFKRRFWEESPGSLRENPSRFRIGDASNPKDPVSLAGPSATERLPRVLVVDDEEDMRSLVTCYVEMLGYEVTAVSSGEQALKAIESKVFEVVITDALMPKMDGRELCRQLKASYRDVKVVVMTSLFKATRFRNEALHSFRADDFLTKPIHFAVLKTSLDRLAPLKPIPIEASR